MAKTAAERNREWRSRNREKQAAATRRWRQARPGYVGQTRQAKVDYVTSLKEGTPCADCGNNFPACCMDFDHRGDKAFDVGTLVGRSGSIDLIKAEISKCDIVCANCHRIRTKDRGLAGWHGRRPYEKDTDGKDHGA